MKPPTKRPDLVRLVPSPGSEPPKITYTVAEAADLLRIKEAFAYRLIRDGSFPCVVIRVGRNYRIPKAPFDRMLGLSETVEATPTG